jgi:hypothetical protein
LLSFFLPSTNSWMVSTGIIFAFIYICIHYLYHIHPPFCNTSPLPHWYQSPRPHASRQSLFSDFVHDRT